MRGVPDDLDLSPLVGYRVDQIALGAFQIQISFGSPDGYRVGAADNSAHISVEGAWELRDAEGLVVDARHGPDELDRPYFIQRLLQRHVSDWRLRRPDRFELTFDSGDTLQVIEDDSRYEYVSIHLPGSKGDGTFL
jgi:hypothetical protein